jgi:HD-GYP domain-containing protein (c-di-GMP phosphodiesterase class II)
MEACYSECALVILATAATRVVVRNENFRRLLLTFGALSDLGAVLSTEADFRGALSTVVAALRETLGVRDAALFTYSDKPSLLTSIAAEGFSNFPPLALIPLLPKNVHALGVLPRPVSLQQGDWTRFFTANGNVSPELFRHIAPLRAHSKLVGLVALGRREDDTNLGDEEVEALSTICSYVALAVQNDMLTKSLEVRIAENLKLMGSIHRFYDNALEAFAAAIDIKHTAIHGHSLRVGRYAALVGEALGLEPNEVAGVKAAGYLHDIGMVAVDKHIFGKPSALDASEFQEMADHTVVGHRIVSSVEFPWPSIPDVVRGHHERADGTGYPDKLRLEDVPLPVRLVAVADTFDAMTSERPYRQPMSVGSALSELVRLAPAKFDPNVVHGFLIQVRRDASGSNKQPFLDPRLMCNIGPTDVDFLASSLRGRTGGRIYSA